jgi:folate-dependent tRNA-U54 methylase TrmFO/GidA
MSGIAVARRCAELTEEIFVVAQMSVEAQQRQRIERNKRTLSLASLVTGIDNYSASSAPMGTASSNNISSLLISQTELSQPRSDMWGGMDAFNMDTSALEEDFFASLIDPSILDSFGANLMGGDLMNQPFFEGLDFGQGFGV